MLPPLAADGVCSVTAAAREEKEIFLDPEMAAPLSAAQLEVVDRRGARCAGLTASGAALAAAMEGLPLDGRSFDEVVAPSPLMSWLRSEWDAVLSDCATKLPLHSADCLCNLCANATAMMSFDQAYEQVHAGTRLGRGASSYTRRPTAHFSAPPSPQVHALVDLNEYRHLLGDHDNGDGALCLPAARLIWQQQCDALGAARTAAGLPPPEPAPVVVVDEAEEAPGTVEDDASPPPAAPPPTTAAPTTGDELGTDALSQQAGDVVLMPAWSFALIGAAVLVSLGLGIAAGCCVFRRREKATGTALTTRNWRLSTVRGQQYAAKTNWSSVVELNVEPEVSEVGALPPSRKISAENHAAAALGLPPRQLSRKFSDAI